MSANHKPAPPPSPGHTPHPQLPLFDPGQAIAPHDAVCIKPNDGHYIVYVDESGDHSLTKIDDNYPVFVLAFCVIYKKHYAEYIAPNLARLKFRHFGHDTIVLHEMDIRKGKPPFNTFSRDERQIFMESLNGLIENMKFVLIACIIDKRQIKLTDPPGSAYHLALGHCLESLHDFLKEKNQENKRTYVIVERRGKNEDNALELEFRRVCDGANRKGIKMPFRMVLADKKINSSGLQLADLVARPIGRHHLDGEEKPNRAFEILRPKFLCRGGRAQAGSDFEGYGLKLFPESAKPR